MKKIFIILSLIALSAILMTSCKKEKKDPTYSARIATYSEDWGTGVDQWVYSYDSETGSVTGVVRNWVENGNSVLDKQWNFAWTYPVLTISGANNYEITFGDNGFAKTMKESGDGWAETYSYTYDANGYLISVSRDGDLRSDDYNYKW